MAEPLKMRKSPGDSQKVAEMILSKGGYVHVERDRYYSPGMALPRKRFQVDTIVLYPAEAVPARGKPQAPQPRLKTNADQEPVSFSDEEMVQMANLNSLSELTLAGSSISDRAFSVLPTLDKLIWLNISDSKNLTDKGACYLGKLSRLKELKLGGCTALSSAGIGYLRTLSNLEMLDLCDIPALGPEILDALLALPRLKTLTIAGNPKLTQEFILKLAALPELSALGVDCSQIAGPMDFNVFPKLKTIMIGSERLPTQDLSSVMVQTVCTPTRRPSVTNSILKFINLRLTEEQVRLLGSIKNVGLGITGLEFKNVEYPPSKLAALDGPMSVIVGFHDTTFTGEVLRSIDASKIHSFYIYVSEFSPLTEKEMISFRSSNQLMGKNGWMYLAKLAFPFERPEKVKK